MKVVKLLTTMNEKDQKEERERERERENEGETDGSEEVVFRCPGLLQLLNRTSDLSTSPTTESTKPPPWALSS
jgi:hypothetical protein